jgi:hypothetical protein
MEALKELLAKKELKYGVGCFLCGLILEDLGKNKKLTGYPLDSTGGGTFPRAGKVAHIKLEFGIVIGDRDFS